MAGEFFEIAVEGRTKDDTLVLEYDSEGNIVIPFHKMEHDRNYKELMRELIANGHEAISDPLNLRYIVKHKG